VNSRHGPEVVVDWCCVNPDAIGWGRGIEEKGGKQKGERKGRESDRPASGAEEGDRLQRGGGLSSKTRATIDSGEERVDSFRKHQRRGGVFLGFLLGGGG